MVATYRIQVQPGFGFGEIEKLLPYLSQLGISHLYLSPITEARRGSTHGYDVVNHNAIREELGGRAGFESLSRAAGEAGLKLIIDFVPNHAGVGPYNEYWQDMLAYGPHSPFAAYFDVDWNPIKPELQGKILLPFLGKTYGEVLDEGELELTYEDGYLYATYFEDRFRLNPASYTTVLQSAMDAAERTEPYWDLKDLSRAYATLEPSEREKAEALRKRFTLLAKRFDLTGVLPEFNGERLHHLLQQQFWRLSYWKTAASEINYRRFFDINGLVALRMEDDQVFWDAHQLLAELLASDTLDGVRIDHVDGLFDPLEYLARLRNVGAGKIWVEKILAPGETLPDSWPVDGTTGYEFMNDVMRVLVDERGRLPLERACRRAVGPYPTFADTAYESKKLVIGTSLSSELFRLSYELDRISEADYHTRDFTLEAIQHALTEIVAVFDRYRTYLPREKETARAAVQLAVHRARSRNPVAEPTVFDFVASVILGDVREDLIPGRRAWVGRFQQYTAPVAAKGVEDTAFYRFVPFSALNEVGGEPDEFHQTLHAFHSHGRFRAHRYPHNLLATATHDHKRGEDTRMRLIALSEVPDLWEETARALNEISEDHRTDGAPSPTDAYLFFQTLVALWDPDHRDELRERVGTYMEKAARESKRQTSWTNPDPSYEEALQHFVSAMIDDARTGPAIEPLSSRLAELAFANSLSQLVLKMTSPGVPDIYQGCELFDLSLVDPDNRRPVDYALRRRYLGELQSMLSHPSASAVQELIDQRDERAKMYITAALLKLRRDLPDLFAGDYIPCETAEDGPWIAFQRRYQDQWLLVAVPRHFGSWENRPSEAVPLAEESAGCMWIDGLTGSTYSVGTELRTDILDLRWGVLISNPPSKG